MKTNTERSNLERIAAPASDLVERVSEITEAARERAEAAQRGMSHNLRKARRRAEDALADGRHEIRQHPVSAVTGSLVVGLVCGVAVGLLLSTRR